MSNEIKFLFEYFTKMKENTTIRDQVNEIHLIICIFEDFQFAIPESKLSAFPL